MKPLNPSNGPNPALKAATGFLLIFLLSGILFSVAHGIRQTGLSPHSISAYYLGSADEMSYPKELSELMESTHVHLFMIPMIFYILCHIFAQTGIASAWKIGIISLTFLNVAGFLSAPYFICFVSANFSTMIPFHFFLFIITAVILTLFPLLMLIRKKGWCSNGEG